MESRIEYIDICKSLGMCLVIMGHLFILGPINDWVMSFYMPMFVILSGLLHSKKDFKTNFMKLLFPYYYLGIICIIFYDGIFSRDKFIIDLISLACGCTAPFRIVYAASSLWFISMIFVVKVIYTLLESMKINRKVFHLVIAIIGLLGYLLGYNRFRIQYIYNTDLALLLLPFYHIGKITGIKRLNYIKNQKVITKLAIMIFCFIVSFLLSHFISLDMFLSGVGSNNLLLFYLVALLGVMSFMVLSMEIERFKFIKKACLIIGKRTLYILPLHYPLVLIFYKIKTTYNLDIYWSYLAFPVILSVSTVLAKGIEVCVKKIKH